MKPTLAVEELRRNITQYLTTTFALDDEVTRGALERFFNDPETGIFRGPYVRVRTPFRPSDQRWRSSLEWAPPRFAPHRHQAQAFERLSSLRSQPQPTLITTGTGSGKTESFLFPILDHCARARRAGQQGVKAVLLYPMNALATDQALRLSEYLQDESLGAVTAGLYIGDKPASPFERVLTSRSDIRHAKPDILITNYKMLDLLLQRVEDLPLWENAGLSYVVLDEFHTYDGAQGTDVAMLLRRLAAAVGADAAQTPLGHICPVATSATLGGGGVDSDSRTDLLNVAGQVFGVPFDEASIIGEDRLSAEEFAPDLDYTLPVPTPRMLAGTADPARDPTALAEISNLVLGTPVVEPGELGRRLSQHILTAATLAALDGSPTSMSDLLAKLPRRGAYAWGTEVRTDPQAAVVAISRFVALLSHARDPDDANRPFLHVDVHMWVRAVSRLLRKVSGDPEFLWSGEQPTPSSGGNTVIGAGEDGEAPTTRLSRPGSYLPSVYCRHCGRSGWMAISPEADPTELVGHVDRIYRSGFTGDVRRRRPLIEATEAEVARRADGDDIAVWILEPGGNHVRPLDPVTDRDPRLRDGVAVLVDMRRDRAADDAAANDRCPGCALNNGIRFLGSGLASLASVAVTELFTNGDTESGEPKTLMFSDSVQDAAHRAGFVADRSYTFSLRALLVSQLSEQRPVALNDLIADLVAEATQPGILAAVVPPDLHDQPGVPELLAGGEGRPEHWDLVAERLAFAAITEFGLRSRQGRTLELTRTAAARVAVPEPETLAGIARTVHQDLPGGELTLHGTLPEPERYHTFIAGLLQRLRTSGAIKHHWLENYLHLAGTKRWAITGGRPTGMPAFGRGVSVPTFVMNKARSSQFDFAGAPAGWFADWASRCLDMPKSLAATYVEQLLPALADYGALAAHTAQDDSRVYGLLPGHVEIQLLGDDTVTDSTVVCDACHRQQPLFPGDEQVWVDKPCPRYRCTGTLRARTVVASRSGRDYRLDYYRQLYRGAGPYQVVAAEHTGVLSRQARERIEDGFRTRRRYTDPNVLSATPTLELGIDIGDLSEVILASLPARPANYVQRVGRAGRRTGNATLLTFVEGRARDLYYLAEPLEMIAGDIAPPGCYLSAVEILRRQYTAYLVDRAARGGLPGVLPLPRLSSQLFGESGWLADLASVAMAHADELAQDFLARFPYEADDAVASHAHDSLREYAARGIAERAEEVERVFTTRLDDLRQRLTGIETAMAGLVSTDPEHARLLRELKAERYDALNRIRKVHRNTDAHGTLVELGFLPNYTLVDEPVELEATLYWPETDDSGDTTIRSETEEYGRTAQLAITEFAPGNTFYANGFKHKITGLDVGTKDRPLSQTWRLCPECGYARTEDARNNTGPCPRCHSKAIADAGCVYQVLAPTRMSSRSRREDARVSDDSDDRDRMYYEVATTVDIDPATLVDGSWRHEEVPFGVDYSRQATVRRFNLGRQRFDVQPTGSVGGQQVRVTGFGVCSTCGYATPDDPGMAAAAQTSASPGARSIAANPHRPWCPRKREEHADTDERVVIAHELHTEALRILLPAVTTSLDERRASFTAALLAGINAHYRGNPEHLRITSASMPDQETGERRQFLVLYDRLPGGTGYLHRLSNPDAFHEVLLDAREVITSCRCNDEAKPACHRCLLCYVSDTDHPLVNRNDALDILDSLLGPDGSTWAYRDVADATQISLMDQLDSELEVLFVEALRNWCTDPHTPGNIGPRITQNGKEILDLRIDSPEQSRVVHWQVHLQKNLRDTIPDVTFIRQDDARLRVTVYLDGWRWHASSEHNRIAGDARKRMRLRADGDVVFQLTWDDVTGNGSAGWQPYLGNAQQAARQRYQQLGGRGEELDELIWTNPLHTVFAFLTDPDQHRWRQRAEATLTGLLQHQPHQREMVHTASSGAAERIQAALNGRSLPEPQDGGITIIRHADAAGCRVVLAVDRRGDTVAFSAFTVLDDTPEVVEDQPDAHKRRWTSWLRWGDVVQFLNTGLGDGLQLAASELELADPLSLAISGGTGAYLALRQGEAVAEPASVPVNSTWRSVLDEVDPEESGLLVLINELAQHDVPAPEVGYELGEQGWIAELAWPSRQVAVLIDLATHGDEDEQRNRDQAYVQAGWDARLAADWSPESLVRHVQTTAPNSGGQQ